MNKLINKIVTQSIGIYFNVLAYIYPHRLKEHGFELFCTPSKRPLKPYHIEFLDSGKYKLINLDDNKIQTYKWGVGSKSVLLVHGWSSHSFRWKNYISKLVNSGFTVYAFDAPAHGNSTGSILHLVMYERAIDEFLKTHTYINFIVSHSMGSFASVYHLFKNPRNLIEKIVIMATPNKVDDFFDYYSKRLRLTNKTLSLIKSHFKQNLKHDTSFFSILNFGREINTPALIIHDREDKECSYTEVEKLANIWTNAELVSTTGMGHELKNDEIIERVITYLTHKVQ
jgi:pimeloyl-ACP methyl ester carboxylesterase